MVLDGGVVSCSATNYIYDYFGRETMFAQYNGYRAEKRVPANEVKILLAQRKAWMQ